MLRDRMATGLGSPRMPWGLAILAACLSLPSVGLGLLTDDHLMVEVIGRGAVWSESFRLSATRTTELWLTGGLSWWSTPGVEVAFFRPLSTLTHLLDVVLFGANPVPMHLQNVALYALLVASVGRALRRLVPARVAGLATLIYALHGGHGATIGWISARNTLLSSLFGVLALNAWLAAREVRRARWLSPLWLALALASGEGGLATLGFLVAFAVHAHAGRAAHGLASLWPHGLVLIAWGVAYLMGGHGVHGAYWYRDVTAAPLQTLAQGLCDLPLWLLSQVGVSAVTAATAMDPWQARAAAVVLVAPLLGLLAGTLREDSTARVLFVGALLALLPALATVPQDRVTMLADLGVSACIAAAIVRLAARETRASRAGAYVLAALHLGLAPLLFLGGLGSMQPIEGAARALASALPADAGVDVVLMNAPTDLLGLYAQNARSEASGTKPRTVHVLHVGTGKEVHVRRLDARSLELQVREGWGRAPLERIWAARLPALGEQRRLVGMHVTVRAVDEAGRPTRVVFQFDEPLESPRLALKAWQGTAPVPWPVPAVGRTSTLPALSLLGSMPR